MNKKTLESLCFLLIIITFIIIGYYTYQSYREKKNSNDSNVEINNFYNVDYLFNNSYIEEPNTIDDLSSKQDKVYMYLDASNIMYIKYTDNEKYNKKIIGLPNKNVTVYYNNLYDNYYELLAKTENNDVYYSVVNLDSAKDTKFYLIGENIDKVYTPLYDKKNVYINQNDKITTNYILYDTDGNLKYIDFNKQYVLKSNLEEKRPYFDYICASNNSNICNYSMIYITFNNELSYNGKILKNDNNETIHVKDVFSSFEIDSNKNIDINNISKKSLKKHSYLFNFYIIDDNQIVYKFDISNKNKTLISLNDNSNKVKEYIYERGNSSKLIIIFDNGTKQTIESGNNKLITTSTTYDKRENNNETVLIQP